MKYNFKIFILITLTILIPLNCTLFEKNDKKVEGCTDPEAYNYNIKADDDDGSCIYECPKFSHALVLTTDMGQTWEKLCVFNNEGSQHSNEIVDVSVIDENNIWMCTENPATILYTSDQGLNWDVQYDDQSKTDFFNYIEMFDLLNGIAMGDGVTQPLILNTSDGGITWNEVNIITDMDRASGDMWRRIDFVNMNIGFFANGIDVHKTVDGGKNWTETNFNDIPYVLKFYNENIGVVAKGSKIYRTSDSGNSWNMVELPSYPGWSVDFEFAENNPNKIWFLGEESLWYSNDAGVSWVKQIQFQHPERNIQDMVITDNYGWTIGYNANNTCYKTSNPENGNWEGFDVKPQNNFKSLRSIDGTDDGIVVFPGYIK